MSRGYLLVRADGRAYGLPVASVLEVGDVGQVMDVPRALPAVRQWAERRELTPPGGADAGQGPTGQISCIHWP